MEKKLFTIIEIKTKKYVEDFVYPSAIFCDDIESAKFLPTYSKASTFAKKINNFYGYKRVKVLTITNN